MLVVYKNQEQSHKHYHPGGGAARVVIRRSRTANHLIVVLQGVGVDRRGLAALSSSPFQK